MSESQCIRVNLKPGKTDEFLLWAKGLSSRSDEVREALQAEGIVAEHIFLEHSESGDSIIFYTKAQDLKKANEAFERSSLPLDVEAKRVMASTWEFSSIKALQKVLDL